VACNDGSVDGDMVGDMVVKADLFEGRNGCPTSGYQETWRLSDKCVLGYCGFALHVMDIAYATSCAHGQCTANVQPTYSYEKAG
jgi:hypothetical protein